MESLSLTYLLLLGFCVLQISTKIHSQICEDLAEIGTIGNKTYYIKTNLRTTWFEAWEKCRNVNLLLASIESQSENEFIANFLIEQDLLVYAIWSSGTDLGQNGQFYWMATGKSLEYVNWSEEWGQPDDGATGRSCIYGFGPEFQWMDLPCDSKTVSSFICQTN